MPFEEFARNYEGVGVTQVEPLYTYNGIEVNTNNHGSNQVVIRLDVASAGNCTVSVDQKDTRYFEERDNYKYSYFRVALAKITKDGVRFVDAKLSPARNIFMQQDLTPGSYVLLVEAFWSHNCREFVVSTYSEQTIDFNLMKNQGGELFDTAQYLLYRDMARQKMDSGEVQTRDFPIHDRQTGKSVNLQHGSVEDNSVGLTFKAYANKTNQTVFRETEFLNVKGFDIISEINNGGKKRYEINPNEVDGVLLLMNPKEREFQASTRTLDQGFLPGKGTNVLETYQDKMWNSTPQKKSTMKKMEAVA